MAIDILSARTSLELLIQGMASGTGVSMGTNEIIVYVLDYNKEQELRNRIGNNYQGFNIKYIMSGKLSFYR